MPAVAQVSSLSEVSPLTPTAPSTAPLVSRTRTPPGTGTIPFGQNRRQRNEELRNGVGSPGELPSPKAHRQTTVGLTHGDLDPTDRRSLVALHNEGVTAGIEHHDTQRSESAVAAFAERRIGDAIGLGEGEGTHHDGPVISPNVSAIQSAMK